MTKINEQNSIRTFLLHNLHTAATTQPMRVAMKRDRQKRVCMVGDHVTWHSNESKRFVHKNMTYDPMDDDWALNKKSESNIYAARNLNRWTIRICWLVKLALVGECEWARSLTLSCERPFSACLSSLLCANNNQTRAFVNSCNHRHERAFAIAEINIFFSFQKSNECWCVCKLNHSKGGAIGLACVSLHTNREYECVFFFHLFLVLLKVACSFFYSH